LACKNGEKKVKSTLDFVHENPGYNAGMRALVTGATGFIGSHLVESLLERGFDVDCLVRDPSRPGWLQGMRAGIIKGDCTEPESLRGVFAGYDIVFHNAGVTKASDPAEYYRVNSAGAANVVEAAARYGAGLRKFVYVSSQAAAGPSSHGRPRTEGETPAPVTDYGRSKLEGERQVLKYKDDIPVAIVRPSAVYGPRDRDIYTFFRLVSKGIRTAFADEHLVSLSYVGDLVDGIILAGTSETKSGDVFFLADERPYDWDYIGSTVAEVLGVNARRVVVPIPLMSLIAIFSEAFSAISGRPTILNRQKMAEVRERYWVADTTRARETLGYSPRHDFVSGAALTAEWYRDNGWL
jgi:nucleoside-diphosphate-sugar epimerase